jgi:hypothetical protein
MESTSKNVTYLQKTRSKTVHTSLHILLQSDGNIYRLKNLLQYFILKNYKTNYSILIKIIIYYLQQNHFHELLNYMDCFVGMYIN